MTQERRQFERESVKIPFIYSLDEGESLVEGEWDEAVTEDIGPVLVGGVAFNSQNSFDLDQKIRIALFMDLKLREVWIKEPEGFPAIYRGKVLRITPVVGGYRIAVIFAGIEDVSIASDMEALSKPENQSK